MESNKEHFTLPTLGSGFWSKIIWLVSYSFRILHLYSKLLICEKINTREVKLNIPPTKAIKIVRIFPNLCHTHLHPVDVIRTTADPAISVLNLLTKHDKGVSPNLQKGNHENFLSCGELNTGWDLEATLRHGNTMNITSCVHLIVNDLITAS